MALTMRLETHEALLLHGKAQEASAEAYRVLNFLNQTNAGIDEREMADLAARVWDRIERDLRDLLYPDPRREILRDEIELGLV